MLLVIDTALAGLSVALLDGDSIVAEDHRLLGRGHAEAVIPAIAAVLGQAGVAAPTSILVDTGPGSFTGLRIGIAAAKALALAWDVPLAGLHATALIAARAFAYHADIDQVAAVLDAGRGQLYVQSFARAGLAALAPVAAYAPADAVQALAGLACAGPGLALLTASIGQSPDFIALSADWPRAADARLLPASACNHIASPLYVRAPDAQPMMATA